MNKKASSCKIMKINKTKIQAKNLRNIKVFKYELL